MALTTVAIHTQLSSTIRDRTVFGLGLEIWLAIAGARVRGKAHEIVRGNVHVVGVASESNEETVIDVWIVSKIRNHPPGGSWNGQSHDEGRQNEETQES